MDNKIPNPMFYIEQARMLTDLFKVELDVLEAEINKVNKVTAPVATHQAEMLEHLELIRANIVFALNDVERLNARHSDAPERDN